MGSRAVDTKGPIRNLGFSTFESSDFTGDGPELVRLDTALFALLDFQVSTAKGSDP
jgi:hypothetical protein